MKKYVLDSYAFLAYLEGESDGKKVISIFEDAVDEKVQILMSVINWGEIYYISLREGGEKRAQLYLKTVREFPIKIFDVDQDLTLEAGNFKANNKMSYADAFAAALTLKQKAILVTGDKEFKPLEGKIKIFWL